VSKKDLSSVRPWRYRESLAGQGSPAKNELLYGKNFYKGKGKGRISNKGGTGEAGTSLNDTTPKMKT